ATIELASQKNSVSAMDRRFANTINGRLPHDDFSNSFDSTVNSPFSTTQSTASGFNYSIPATTGIHHHHPRKITAHVLDEI
ncbi:hypothetical protein PFISCL1PPCAC_16239, partial [Pristionchus fissidentatus]